MSEIQDLTAQMGELRKRYHNFLRAEAERAEDGKQGSDELPVQRVIEQMEILRQEFQKLKPAPEKPLTIPAIFGWQFDENFISSYLAYVLNPQQNGIGTAPLAALLKEVFHQDVELDADTIRVYREYQLNNQRLDVMVEMNDEPLLVIENKLYSPEGDRQTRSYYSAVTEAYPDAKPFFIYLTINGSKASSEKFHPLSYKGLRSTFRKVRYDWRHDVRNSILWEDFLSHIEEHIVMEKGAFNISDQTRLYFENYRMITQLENQFKREWPGLIEFVETKLKSKMGAISDEFLTNFQTSPRYPWQQLYKIGWGSNELHVHFEFHLDPSSFENSEVWFSVDVEEGKRTVVKRFRQMFDEYYPLLKSEFETKEITYHGVSSRDHPYWVASKVYPFTPDLSRIGDELYRAIEEFSFLIKPIDELVGKVTNKP